MKTQYIIISAVALLACAACTKTVEQPEPEGVQMTFKAYQEGAKDTKTTVQDGGTQVYWEPADEIKVFFKNSTGRFISQNSELADVADFAGTLSVLVGANEGAGSTTKIYGLYPYRADAVYDGSFVTTTLPSAQTGRAGSFAKNTHISLAATNANSVDLGFYNVTGGLRFSLTQEGINSVTFEGNDGEAIAGKIKMIFEDGIPVVKEVLESESIITLTAPAGSSFQTGQWYYIEAIPGTLSAGFKMVFTKGTETAKITSSTSVTIRRGKYGSLADADEDLIFKDAGGDEPSPSDVIQFADPIAKYACAEKFDANGDGEVSYDEAAAATSFAGLFDDWTTVKAFDEIKYFTGVTSTVGVFTGLTKLESITIPSNITALGTFQGCTSLKTVVLPADLGSLPEYCFDGCIALTDVTIPSGIKTLPDYCFQNCSSLVALELPSSVTSLNQYAFSGCSSLTDVTLPTGLKTIPDYCFQNCSSLVTLELPSTVTSLNQCAFSGCSSFSLLELPSGLKTIGNNAFMNCKALTSLDFPSTLVSIGAAAFSGCTGITTVYIGAGVSIEFAAFSSCSSLASVYLPTDLKSIPDYCFQNCFALSTITWPEALSSIGSGAFDGCHFAGDGYTLQLPATVTSIGSYAFTDLLHLIIPSLSVVSIESNSFGDYSLTFLYVPIGMVEMYKVRKNWSNYAGRILPIEEYPAQEECESIDLGLSVKWATRNVGAVKPEEFGALFKWGETKPMPEDDFSSTYIWCNGSYNRLTKYCPSDKIDYWGGSGSPDGKIALDPEDDAVRVNWGGSWRMPTDAEWTELKNNCTLIWTANYNDTGKAGLIVTSKKAGYTDRSIFLPAVGFWDGGEYYDWGAYGTYWSSSLNTNNPTRAMFFEFGVCSVGGGGGRYCGQSVRPVKD